MQVILYFDLGVSVLVFVIVVSPTQQYLLENVY